MSFPYEFSTRSGDYDFISSTVNLAGNGTILAVGGISLGVITYLALKALGFSKMATTLVTAVPVSIGAFGIVAGLVGIVFLGAMVDAFQKGFGRG